MNKLKKWFKKKDGSMIDRWLSVDKTKPKTILLIMAVVFIVYLSAMVYTLPKAMTPLLDLAESNQVLYNDLLSKKPVRVSSSSLDSKNMVKTLANFIEITLSPRSDQLDIEPARKTYGEEVVESILDVKYDGKVDMRKQRRILENIETTSYASNIKNNKLTVIIESTFKVQEVDREYLTHAVWLLQLDESSNQFKLTGHSFGEIPES